MSSTLTRAPGRLALIAFVTRSERIKLLSLRSTWFSLLIVLLLMVGISVAMSLSRSTADSSNAFSSADANDFVVSSATLGALAAQLVVATLGVMAVGSEYSSGTVRPSITAVPARWPFLLGKLIVIGATTFATACLAVAGGWLACASLMASKGYEPTLSFTGALQLFGAVGYLTLISMMAAGMTVVVRSAAAAITLCLGVLLVLPVVLSLLSTMTTWASALIYYVPASAGQLMYSPHVSDTLTPEFGWLVVVGWTLTSAGIAFAMLQRRDVQ